MEDNRGLLGTVVVKINKSATRPEMPEGPTSRLCRACPVRAGGAYSKGSLQNALNPEKDH
jgi:hypothetical protein